MSGLLDKWLSRHGCGDPATPAIFATPGPDPAQTLAEMGSNRSATPCYPEPESAEGSNGVATALLPRNVNAANGLQEEVAGLAGVAGFRRPCPKVAPPEFSTVARITEAGGTSRLGGYRPDRTLYREAELPADAPPELVTELEREGWHVARILAGAERATPRPDLDPAEWQGEHEEDELP